MIPTELDISLARLNNATAAKLEFDLAKAQREFLSVSECFGLLDRLRVTAIEKTTWQEKNILETALDEELVRIREIIQKIQESARW